MLRFLSRSEPSAKSTSETGVFGQTKSIQRVHTVGGRAPVEACARAQAGKVARVGYKATYCFYVPQAVDREAMSPGEIPPRPSAAASAPRLQ